jgi:hypothetical protein
MKSTPGHEVVVEVALPLGQGALDDVLVLLGHLLLHLALQSPEQERTKNFVETLKTWKRTCVE